MRKALCIGAVLGLAVTMGSQSAFAGGKGSKGHFKTFTPFSRVAQLPVVKDSRGKIDHVATYAKANAAALALADYVARYNDSVVLGDDVIKGEDWVLGGTSKTCRQDQNCLEDEIADAILGIPAPERIDPDAGPMVTMPDGSEIKNVKKANVLDFCNEHYAKQALGVDPITGTKGEADAKYVVNGYSHTPALPCEVSIWNDDKHIYVDMLDPNAIFTLFFTDALFSENMQDPAFAEALTALPPQVKSEIRAIILHAMGEFDPRMTARQKMLGPKYHKMEQVVAAVDASPENSPYKHVGYTRVGGGVFDSTDAKNVTQAIINTMSIHGQTVTDPDGTVREAGEHAEDLESILSPGSSWRSARPTPLPLPGFNFVIEACSPKYAKMAMSTGLHHVTALPCEITVQVIDQDPTVTGKETLVVSYLDPHFMLGALFADISEAEQQAFEDKNIPGEIMDDLQDIVAAALEGYDLSTGVPITYDMLP